jgi:hypothetical protein
MLSESSSVILTTEGAGPPSFITVAQNASSLSAVRRTATWGIVLVVIFSVSCASASKSHPCLRRVPGHEYKVGTYALLTIPSRQYILDPMNKS